MDEDNGRLVVAQGTPGVLSIFKEGDFPGGSMNLLNTFLSREPMLLNQNRPLKLSAVKLSSLPAARRADYVP